MLAFNGARLVRNSSVLTQAARRLNSTLVLAEHDGKALNPATLNAITAAKAVGNKEIVCLAAGADCGPVVQEVAKIQGLSKVGIALPRLEQEYRITCVPYFPDFGGQLS